ncbi:hypothetical protein D3870_20285 [Noviherbaspirillum cavernae]|uniref:Virulence factor n=1 Tax=Noviherbaspirillum cavernae TaxID=2320862 RepID=A0A418WWH1_9BURK|nr:hypothetical protein [Noviherbaspirillum cavernae]RJF97050.1 hypothetical protein D3870_20285 [Noviherbaspirillum cavernae]
MKTSTAIAASLLAGITLLSAAPAMARGDVQWSVTVGSPAYHVPPAVVYAPPPVVYAPPPRVVYVQPQPVYVHPQPVYRPGVAVVEYGYRERGWQRHHHGRDHDGRYERHYRQDRHDRHDRRDYRY